MTVLDDRVTENLKTTHYMFATLDDKILNFLNGRHRFVGHLDAKEWIKKNFPSWQYNGVATFDDIMNWCEHHFGNNWVLSFETIYFKYERDKMFFLLRWM